MSMHSVHSTDTELQSWLHDQQARQRAGCMLLVLPPRGAAKAQADRYRETRMKG